VAEMALRSSLSRIDQILFSSDFEDALVRRVVRSFFLTLEFPLDKAAAVDVQALWLQQERALALIVEANLETHAQAAPRHHREEQAQNRARCPATLHSKGISWHYGP